MTLLEKKKIVKIWTYWEFEHSSKNIIRVIDAPEGLELFAEDVFQILAPELNNEKIIVMGTKMNQRFTSVNGEIIAVNTLDALAIHALSGVVEAEVVRGLMQWVRSNILPVFKRENSHLESRQQKLFQQIDFRRKQSLLSYLLLKGLTAEEKIIEFYIDIIYKKIPLSRCSSNFQDRTWRNEYFQIFQSTIPQVSNYENCYETLVLSATNLLNAQELDLYVFNVLREGQSIELLSIMNQALVIQAMNSTVNELVVEVKEFYLQLLKSFSEELTETIV